MRIASGLSRGIRRDMVFGQAGLLFQAADIQALAAVSSPGSLFATSPFVVKGSYIQINPCDERCYAGQVTIQPDARGQFPQVSGELFTLRRATSER